MVNLLKLRYDSLLSSAERGIRVDLEHLLDGVKLSLKALEAGEQLNEHLLSNAGHVTASIGKRNALLELRPFIDDTDGTKVTK